MHGIIPEKNKEMNQQAHTMITPIPASHSRNQDLWSQTEEDIA